MFLFQVLKYIYIENPSKPLVVISIMQVKNMILKLKHNWLYSIITLHLINEHNKLIKN